MAHFLKKTKDRLYEHIGQCITRRKMPQGTNIRTHYAMKVFFNFTRFIDVFYYLSWVSLYFALCPSVNAT